MTGKVLRTDKKKTQTLEEMEECNVDSVKLQYKKQANKASKAVRMAKRDFERKIAKSIKTTLNPSLSMLNQNLESNQVWDH